MGDTWMLVSQETCTRAFADSLGPILLGPEILKKIEPLRTNPFIDSIHIDIWRRYSGTELIITANPSQWPSTPSLSKSSSPSSRPNTSLPSPPTSDGTQRSQVNF